MLTITGEPVYEGFGDGAILTLSLVNHSLIEDLVKSMRNTILQALIG
jgi:hypothetical protein